MGAMSHPIRVDARPVYRRLKRFASFTAAEILCARAPSRYISGVVPTSDDQPHSSGCVRPCRSRKLRNARTTWSPAPFESWPGWRARARIRLDWTSLRAGLSAPRLLAAGLTVVFTGVLELLQLFVPGRHARLEDFLVDALATLGGFAIVSIIDFAITSMRRSNPT